METLLAIMALAITAATAQTQTPFYLMALRSASPIHFGVVQANGSDFWIGKNAGNYCPPNLNITCPNSTTTIYSVNEAKGTLYLDVVVPGGQQVYIEPSCGKVEFTRPHSSYMPPGSITEGWSLQTLGDYNYLAWRGETLNNTVFCPTGGDADPNDPRFGLGPWELYAVLPNVPLPSEKCLAGRMLAANATGAGAWEYI